MPWSCLAFRVGGCLAFRVGGCLAFRVGGCLAFRVVGGGIARRVAPGSIDAAPALGRRGAGFRLSAGIIETTKKENDRLMKMVDGLNAPKA